MNSRKNSGGIDVFSVNPSENNDISRNKGSAVHCLLTHNF